MQRAHRLTPRFSDDELGVVLLAAAVSGVTPTGFVAKAAVDVAAGRVSPASAGAAGVAEALGELLLARRQVQRFGVLVNQAMAKWHSTDVPAGQPPAELMPAVVMVGRALAGLEQAALAVRTAHTSAGQLTPGPRLRGRAASSSTSIDDSLRPGRDAVP